MVDATQWLNQTFPTPESREAIEILFLSRYAQEEITPSKCHFAVSLAGELDLSEFINLESLMLNSQSQLTALQGIENLTKLTSLTIHLCPNLAKPFTFLDSWKQEIEQLKAQLTEYEQPETSSDSNEPLNTKIQQKKQELQQAITSGRKSTAHLRKEIQLLEKIQSLESQINQLQAKEANYQQQIQQKDQQITAKQTQITQLQSQAQQNQTKIAQLEGQIKDLQAEKQAIQEKMLQERQEALAKWEQEKTQLQTQITQLKEQKDTFQKSADYLRTTLKDTETQLQDSQQRILALEADKSDLLNQLSQAQEIQQNYLNQEKSQLTKEIALIKEAIHV